MGDADKLKIFKAFPLLADVADAALGDLAEVSELHHWPAHQMVLKQGQVNHHLYFLVRGQVGVYVDGGLVSTLNNPGDLLGEMSVINRAPCGATIVTDEPTDVISVDADDMMENLLLHKIYARVLSFKLHQTNQKAKHFEELTLQLKATQAELDELQKQKDQEGSRSHAQLLRRVSEYYQREILPNESRWRAPMLGGAVDLFSSIHRLYSSREAIQKKKVLIADPQRKQQLVAKLALGGTGVDLDVVSTVEDGKAKVAAMPFDLVFVDSSFTELANFVQMKSPQTGLVLMTSDQIPNYLGHLKQLGRMPHIVSRDENDRTYSVKNIITTVSKLLNKDLFGLEKYLSWGAEVQTHPITNSKERPELIASVETYLEKLGIRKTQRERVHTVLEELLMNAIYDAPCDANGKPLFNHLPRTHEVHLALNQQGTLRYACDGMNVAISVEDPFGALQGETLLRYLENCYSDQGQDINATEGKGGGGKGLHQIVQNSELVVFNLAPGRRTEVVAVFNLEIKETEHLNPSFHLFIQS